MTGTKTHIEDLKRKAKAESQAKQAAQGHGESSAADSRASRYIAQEKSELERRTKLAKANKDLRQG